MFNRNILLTAAVAASTVFGAGAVSAATVGPDGFLSVGDQGFGSTILDPNTNDQFKFTASEALRIKDFSVTGNGFNEGDDLMQLTFGTNRTGTTGVYDQSGTFDMTEIKFRGDVANAGDFLDGFTLAANESFYFLFSYGNGSDPLLANVTFDAIAPAPVPLPAAGGMLLFALGATGYVARRKKKADA